MVKRDDRALVLGVWVLERQESKCGASGRSQTGWEGAELPEDRVFQGDAGVRGSEPVTSETPESLHTGMMTDGWGTRAAEDSPVVTGVIRSTPMRATGQ